MNSSKIGREFEEKAYKFLLESVKGAIMGYEKVKNTGKLEIIRGADEKIKRIVKVKDDNSDIFFKKEMRDGIMNINNRMDELVEIQKLSKKKSEKTTA